jgi:Tfp pilus assembly protein PilZ
MVNGSCKKDLWTASVSADSQGLNEGADRRAFERYPANLQARLFYGNTIYSGMITNLSKSGMFVSTRVKFPVNSEFVMVVNLNNRSMKIPVKVRRSVKKDSDYYSKADNGIGVELLGIPQCYMEYVGACKSSLHVSY